MSPCVFREESPETSLVTQASYKGVCSLFKASNSADSIKETPSWSLVQQPKMHTRSVYFTLLSPFQQQQSIYIDQGDLYELLTLTQPSHKDPQANTGYEMPWKTFLAVASHPTRCQ